MVKKTPEEFCVNPYKSKFQREWHEFIRRTFLSNKKSTIGLPYVPFVRVKTVWLKGLKQNTISQLRLLMLTQLINTRNKILRKVPW